eukprot:scaffold170405_cov34-Tisochrysis_lutea.AAC.1
MRHEAGSDALVDRRQVAQGQAQSASLGSCGHDGRCCARRWARARSWLHASICVPVLVKARR